MSHGHPVPPRSDFDTFPVQLKDWSGRNLPELSDGGKGIMKSDNNMRRDYQNNGTRAQVDLFIVYYGPQQSGDALHSPRNCLPGAGWDQVSSGVVQISNPA